MAPPTARHWAEALEPRLLHSADLSPLLLGGAVLPAAEQQLVLDAAQTGDQHATAASEIVFVDATVPDADTLLADLQAQQAAGRPLEVVVLQADDDGLAVIGRTLEGRSGLAAIHLIGHGADGRLQLGATVLDGQTVLQRAGELAAWQGALSADADLLLYGCDVAAGSAGRALVADLAALTGADVAASDDLTGAAAAGGDWLLEVRTGAIEAALAPSAAAQQAYAGTLAVEINEVQSKKSGGNVNTLTWHHDTDAGNNRMLVVQLVVSSQLSDTEVSYQGRALTLLARQDSTLALGTLRTEIWYLLAPTVGHGDVYVTSSISADLIGGSVSFRNVDQSTPFGTVARAAHHNSSVTLTTSAASGDVVIDVAGSKGVEADSYGSGQTRLWEESQGDNSGDLWGSASRESGAASVTMSRTLQHDDGGERWVYLAVAVKQSNANTAPVITSNGGGATAAVTVAENSTGVTTVAASDAEGGTLSYSISGGADAARFAIDASTGVLRFVAAPNAEAPADADADNVYDVTVRASDGTLATTQAIAVSVSDVNEFALGTIGDNNGTADQVLESAAIGSSVGLTARATDADASNNTVAYSLTDNAGGRFSIDAVTGVVRVAGALDREAAASHNIVVRAVSSDGSSRSRSFTIGVLDSDEHNTGPVTDTDGAANQVDETAGIGTLVGITARASDADATLNTISYSLDDSAGGRFAVNAASGVLRVAGALDYESAASHTVVVRATSADGSASTGSFTIAVNNISETGVGTVSDSDATVNVVDENLAPGAATGLVARASDADAGDVVSYTLADDAGGRFTVDATTGVVRSAAVLDAEAAASWDVIVRAASSDGSSTQQTFTIAVGDRDEYDVGAPTDGDGTANQVDEDAAIGTLVGIRAVASDADSSSNGISYSLTDSAGGRFAIDAASGRVSVAAALDREAAASHQITVRAVSADGSSATSSFTIAIGDVNEYFVAAVADIDGTANTVAESAAAGTVVGITAAAVDADASQNTIGYSLLDDAGGRFVIDAASGVVRLAGGIDFEAASSHRITVQALSADGSSARTDYTIAVSADNEHSPVFNSAPAAVVAENSGAVIHVAATDADLPAADLVYTIGGGADAALFSIDATTGVLSFVHAPDFERPLDADGDNRYQVQVSASDGSRSAAQSLLVTVADDNETPLLTSHAGAASVAVTMTEGDTAVTTVAAADPEGRALSYRISGGADSTLFAVDAASGVLRWIHAPDFETAADSGGDNVYDVTVAASDGVHDVLQHFSVGVADRNESPTIGQPIGDRSASEDEPFTLKVPAGAFADVDAGDSLAWSAKLSSGAALPSWLVFDAATRTFSGTPANADVGSLVLRIEATDAAGASVAQDFVLTVVNSNDSPTAGQALAAQQVVEGERFEFTVPTGTLADVDSGDRLTFSARLASGQPLPDWLSFDADQHRFSGTPQAGDGATLVVRIVATDNSGAQAYTELTIAVQAAPVQPVAAPVVEVPIVPPPAPPAPAPVPPEPEPRPEPESEPAAADAAAPGAAAEEALVDTPQMGDRAADVLAPPPVVVTIAAADQGAPVATVAAPQRGGSAGSASDAVLAPAVLPQFASLGTGGSTLGAWLNGSDMQRTYEAMQQQMQEAAQQRRTAMASGVALSGGLSIGYVVWLVRGGVLMSSMLSTLPAWKMLDPLPVLAAATIVKARRGGKDAEADDVERLFDEGHTRPLPAAPPATQPPTPPAGAAADKIPEESER